LLKINQRLCSTY